MDNNIEKNNEINEEIQENENVSEASSEPTKKPFPLWIIIICAVAVVAISVVVILLTLGGDKSNANDGNQGTVPPASDTQNSNLADYTVTILDDLGNPISDVIVKFADEEGNNKIHRTGSDGVATLSSAKKGNYSVTIDASVSSATVFEEKFVLTATENSRVVRARNNDATMDISGDVDEGCYAHQITVGDFSVYTTANKTTYLVFSPTETGIYGFTISGDSQAYLGYYGMADEVKLINLGEFDEESKTLSVPISGTDFKYIIGVDSDKTEDVNISVKRIANLPYYIYGDVDDGTTAEPVNAGTTTFTNEAGKTSYAVFTPGFSGVYKISFSSSDLGMTVGYYGLPMFVQSTHRGDGEYDGKSFELIIQDGSTPYVLGLNFTVSTSADLIIERIGDAPFDPEYAPWTNVPATGVIEKCELPAGSKLIDFDITDPTLSVYLGDDGYYYTSDGKLVYVRLGSVGTAGYLDVSIAYISGFVDQNFGQNFGGYVYENGEFVGKYSYNSMIESYYNSCDASGVCPLTAELAEAFKVHGNNAGWWKFGTINYLFGSVAIVPENAWLFLCCTVE